tara:strand:- start:2878 stop:3603 length:726 start_codon:yes stop_codon:yes gene_type:complete
MVALKNLLEKMIINTRPIDLAKKANALLQKANLEFLHIPLTKIKKLTPSSEELSWIESLEEFDSIIFTSQSAVKYGVFYLERKKFIPSIISIGLATQDTLRKSNLSSKVPLTHDSEGLAELIKKNSYKRCLVFCGNKIPRLAHHTKVKIKKFSCYESQDDANPSVDKIKGLIGSVVLIYNLQSLKVLLDHLKMNHLKQLNLVVASKRIQKNAVSMGADNCLVAEGPYDEDMIRAAIGVLGR